MIATGFQVSVLSKVGGRERNEDACGYWAGAHSPLACYVLADGAGGHGGGDVASQIAVQTVLDHFSHNPQATPSHVLDLLGKANEAIIAAQASDRRLADMRSTIVLLEIDSQRRCAFWGHVGDSRLYCFRKGKFALRTKDHSLLQDMLDAGLARADATASAADRNVLTGSLGGEDCYYPSAIDEPYPIEDGCAFLICSDGFWSALNDSDMESCLRQASSPESWLKLMEQAFVGRIRSGSDNYSAIAVWFNDENERTRVLETYRPSLSGE